MSETIAEKILARPFGISADNTPSSCYLSAMKRRGHRFDGERRKSNFLAFSIKILAIVSIVGIDAFLVPPNPTFSDNQPAPQIDNSDAAPAASEPGPLKMLAKRRGIRFGAMYQWDFRGGLYDQIFENEMNVMTAGTFMLDGDISHKSRTEFDFSEMDEKINWGLSRSMEVHGHTLVWFDDIADWVKASPPADVESIMNGRIDAFVKRYAGKIKVWDVVNEAVDDDGTIRIDHKWAEAMGTDYIRKAFVRAHAADPNAILRYNDYLYNDYFIENNKKKFEGIKALLIDLKKHGAPVHALGWQMHVTPTSFDAATFLAHLNEIADLGFDNYITELDVELPENPAAADYENQKQTYKKIVQTFLAARRHKTIVVWGLRDGDPDWLTDVHPLLFDENLHKKPAYFGIQEAFLMSTHTDIAPPTDTPLPINTPMDTHTPPFIYHGVTTHSWSSLWGLTEQADVIKAEVDAYEAAVGRPVAWVGFAHEWKTDGRAFPSKVAASIKNRGATPLIFLNLRSFDIIDEKQPVEPLYTLSAIISGQFDSDFIAWADAAKRFGSEIIVSWGWEMNGEWAVWSGAINGGPAEGPRRFRKAYRHIVELMRKRGAHNIRWAFHINFPEYPDEPWNAFENYYPGDDVIDATGVSIYGAQNPTDDACHSFVANMDTAYSRLVKMAAKKPIFIFEFAVPNGHPLCNQAAWADDALSGIFSGRWPAVRGFAWWNDYWSQDDNPAHNTEMRIEALPDLATVFKSRLFGADNVGERPPILK